MVKADRKNISFIFLTVPLIIYEITFALFVIYYIQPRMPWFKISFLSIAVSAITALVKILSGYNKWNKLSGDNKKTLIISLLPNFLFFALYIFCLLVQMDQWKVPGMPTLFIIPLLAVPPLILFAGFLYSDARNSDIPNENQ